MERFFFFFLVLFLWGNASGIGVWDGRPAQHWRRGGFKSFEGPPSLFPSQQTTSSSSSPPSAVQSFEVGAMHAESISNSNTRLVSWKPNVQGGSFVSQLNPQAQGAASVPVSAQSLGRGAGLRSQYTAGDQEIHGQYPPPSRAQGVFTAQSSTPSNCAYRRRPSPFNSVPTHLKPQGPTYGPGYRSGQFSKPVSQSQRDSLYQQDNFVASDSSERLSSQTSPQSLQTQYVPVSNPVATSQSLASASKPPQQGSYGVSSSWYALQGQSIPLASRSRLQTQASRLLPPFQGVSSASKPPPQQESYGVQSGNFALWRQTSPSASGSTLQTQTSSLATPSQSLESTWLDLQRQRIPSFPQPSAQSLASASDSSRQGTYGVSSDTRPTLQTQAPRPVASSQILASAFKTPEQGNYGVQSNLYASLEQSNPSSSQLSQYAKGLANQYSMSQSSLDQTVPVFSAQLQTAGIRNVADLGSSSLYTPLQGQDVQASWFDALNQVPAVQTQSSYKPVVQSQGLENQYNFPPQTWVRADPSGRAQWYRVTHAGLEAVQTIEPIFPFQSFEGLYNQAASSNNPPVSQSPNSPVSFGFAPQNRGTPTSTQALSPLHPTMLQVAQSPWP